MIVAPSGGRAYNSGKAARGSGGVSCCGGAPSPAGYRNNPTRNSCNFPKSRYAPISPLTGGMTNSRANAIVKRRHRRIPRMQFPSRGKGEGHCRSSSRSARGLPRRLAVIIPPDDALMVGSPKRNTRASLASRDSDVDHPGFGRQPTAPSRQSMDARLAPPSGFRRGGTDRKERGR